MWNIILLFILLIIGIVLTIKGGDIVVCACYKLSKVTGINDVLIGSTLVSLATTMPELTITILGMSQNAAGLAIGDGFGTILVNSCLVLGITLSSMSLKRVGKQVLSKLVFMTVMVIVLSIFCLLNLLNIYIGIIFLFLFLFYFVKTILEVKNELIYKNKINNENPINETNKPKKDKVLLFINFLVGALLIFSGAQIIVNSTERISSVLNISSTFIGLIMVAFGTSLPELITSIISIKKKRLNMALGNIIGANIINLTLLFSMAMILSGTKGIQLTQSNLIVLLPSVIISSLLLVVPIFLTKRTYRWQGISLITLYAIYCIIIILTI